MLEQAADQAVALAVRIGQELAHDSRPFFVAGLVPATWLDPDFLRRVAARLDLDVVPTEAALIHQWYEAICQDDDDAARHIEAAIDAAGLHAEAIAAVRAIDRFSRAVVQLLAVPGDSTRMN